MADDCVVQGLNATGTIRVTGLNNGGRITITSIDDVSWTALPAVPLAQRNALNIQNKSGVEIKLNYDNTVVGYVGVVLSNNNERLYDVTDAIPIYAKASAGTVDVTVEEIS